MNRGDRREYIFADDTDRKYLAGGSRLRWWTAAAAAARARFLSMMDLDVISKVAYSELRFSKH